MAVRLETGRNANWSIRAFSPPFWPGMETDPPTSGTYPGAASWRDSERTRAARGDGAAHRGDATARHEAKATATASHRRSSLSADFSLVRHRPRLPRPRLSPALGFSSVGFLFLRNAGRWPRSGCAVRPWVVGFFFFLVVRL